MATSLGRAYPQESDVRHTYERASHGRLAGYPVRATATFAAEYWLDGVGPFPLPSTRRTYETAYVVRQLQAVLLRQ
jgi:hypothetical protein